ncbi:MAG: ABC transporter substrate-binding protein, partial [Microcoleus sp. SIO2G3]|nr:ABC transporter substrate-binding protein [Microcoleus sp. SIO2G3]
MKTTAKLFFLALLAIVTLACNRTATHFNSSDLSIVQAAPQLADCRSVAHLAGETQICGRPQKVAVIGSNLLEILLKLDVQPAGFADYFVFRQQKYDRPSQQIPYLGDRITSQPANLGQLFDPSLEAILKLKPDLILGSEFNQAQYQMLSNIAPTLLFTWFDSENALSAIAQAVGQPEIARELTVETQQKIAEAKKQFASIATQHPKILLISLQEQQIELLSQPDSCTSLIENLGFQLVYPPGWDASNSFNSAISLEALPQL